MNIPFPEGFKIHEGYFKPAVQKSLVDELRQVILKAPLFTPTMPKSGKPFSVQMTNCGELGWISDRAGYRYQKTHPVTGSTWPKIPNVLLDAWISLSNHSSLPQACLVNFYGKGAKLGLHRDEDEEDMNAPVLSFSLGDDCLFRIGGKNRNDRTRSIRLKSGDVVILGGHSRACFHGVDRIYFGTSNLLKNFGRINLTLRRVTVE